jgi:hypothetical protein
VVASSPGANPATPAEPVRARLVAIPAATLIELGKQLQPARGGCVDVGCERGDLVAQMPHPNGMFWPWHEHMFPYGPDGLEQEKGRRPSGRRPLLIAAGTTARRGLGEAPGLSRDSPHPGAAGARR